MTLGDLLEYIDENTVVLVVDSYDDPVASYDGRNSIDPRFNDYDVNSIWVAGNLLTIGIIYDPEESFSNRPW